MTDPRNAFSLDAYLADLAPLINLDCGTRTPAGVARVADILTEKYEAIGWSRPPSSRCMVSATPR